MRATFLALSLLYTGALYADPNIKLSESQKRPLSDVKFEPTEQRLARGEWLVNGLLRCYDCHSPTKLSVMTGDAAADRKGAGRIYSEREGRRMVSRNITPDAETGIGNWTDDMLARAIREGVGNDGRVLGNAMPYHSMYDLSDEDMASIVVYLRAQKPIHNPLPSSVLPEQEQRRLADNLKPITEPVPEPDRDDPVAYGRYLLKVGECAGCHTAWRAPRIPGLLGGGNEISGSEGEAYSTNITPHPTGMGYGEAGFITIIQTGKNGTLSDAMPWHAYRNIPETELKALYAFLQTRHPVNHLVSNLVPPSMCEICEQEHGMGAQNELIQLESIPVDPEILAKYVGSYYSEEYNFTVNIWLDDGILKSQEPERAVAKLIALSDSRFLMEGGLSPLHFERDADGQVTSLVLEEVEELRLVRTDTP